jgi:hypothetical protein
VVGLVALALLAAGGYVAADKVSQAGAGTSNSSGLVRLVTTVREPVKVRVHGHTVVRWRVRRKVVEAQAQTVMQKLTVRTPAGTKVVTRPVVTYRKKVVKLGGKTSTVVLRGKTSTVVTGGKTSTVAVPQTITDSRTSTVSRTETDVQTVTQTVTQPVTVVETETVVTTITLPGTTVTAPVP